MRHATSAPFFFGSRFQGTTHVRGDFARFFGHKIAAPDGGTDGIFGEWAWDGKTLTVQNDRYGFFPLFYYAKGADVGVSPLVSTLIAAGADAELNDAAVALFLRLGQFIGNDTPFRHIHCLPPNATLAWNSDGLRVTGGYENVRENRSISRSDAVHRYVELFAGAIKKRLPNSTRFALPLSGGRDSRHVLFELCRTGFKPQLCATVVQYPDDATVAAMLTNELGIRHVVVEQRQNFFDAEIRKNELTSFGVDHGTWPLLLNDVFVKETIDSVYDGIGGDVLSAGLFLTPSRDALFRGGHLPSIVNDLLPNTEHLLQRLLTPSICRRWNRELASHRL
ncbi:MAG TPA: hypothetical protein VJU53_12150, partial [Burkholderiaceae bacterium]|nr:hypothetical protein [Burkholderiaceae bacterium]